MHGDMEGAWNEDLLEAARIGRAASSGIDWTRTEGAALHAAVEAGQDALRRGATSEEAVAAIHAAGAESIGPKFFGASIGRILWEDTAASLIAESEVVGNRTARFGTSEERATLAEIAAKVSGLTRGERTWGRMVNEYFLREINKHRCLRFNLQLGSVSATRQLRRGASIEVGIEPDAR